MEGVDAVMWVLGIAQLLPPAVGHHHSQAEAANKVRATVLSWLKIYH